MSKVAAKHSVPLSAILALNPQITNPNHLFIEQILQVPNASDVPENAEFDIPSKASELVKCARSVVNSAIKYKLGSGGMHPRQPSFARRALRL